MAPIPLAFLHHIARATADVERCRDFYVEILGFRDLPRPPFSFRGAWLFGYGFQIHVIENPALAPGASEEIHSRGEHLAFATTDPAAVRERLQEAGVRFLERTNAGGAEQIFFQDPDGYHIEVAAYGDPAIGYEGRPMTPVT